METDWFHIHMYSWENRKSNQSLPQTFGKALKQTCLSQMYCKILCFPLRSVGGQVWASISMCQPSAYVLGSARFPVDLHRVLGDSWLINLLGVDLVSWSSFRGHIIIQGLQRSQLKPQGPNVIKISLNLKQASVNHITLWMPNLA